MPLRGFLFCLGTQFTDYGFNTDGRNAYVEGDYTSLVEQVASRQFPNSELCSDPTAVTSLAHNLQTCDHQNPVVPAFLPSKVLVRKDEFPCATHRHFKSLDLFVKHVHVLALPSSYRANTGPAAYSRLSAGLERHFHPLDSEGGSLSANNQARHTAARKYQPITHSRCCCTVYWSSVGTTGLKPGDCAFCARFSTQLSLYHLTPSVHTSCTRFGSPTPLQAFRTHRAPQCHITLSMRGDFPCHLGLVWNRRYHTSSSSTSGSGSSSGKGSFNFGSGNQYIGKSLPGGYDSGDQAYGHDEFSVANSKVLFEEEWDELTRGLVTTAQSLATIPDQFDVPQPQLNGQPSLAVPSQVPLLPAPRYKCVLPLTVTSYGSTPEPLNSTFRDPFVPVHLAHSQDPPIVPLYEQPFINSESTFITPGHLVAD